MDNKERNYCKTLYEAAAELNSTHAPDAVLNSIVENVARSLGAKGCSLALLTPDKKLLLHTVTFGLSEDYLSKGPLLADKSISEALKGKAVTILDATSDERVQYREEKRREGIASILSVPMMLRGEIIGVIRVYTAEQRQFSEDDIYFVQAVANLGAIAMENARLYESIQKDYEQLRQEMLEWRASLASSGTPRSLWFLRHSREQSKPGV